MSTLHTTSRLIGLTATKKFKFFFILYGFISSDNQHLIFHQKLHSKICWFTPDLADFNGLHTCKLFFIWHLLAVCQNYIFLPYGTIKLKFENRCTAFFCILSTHLCVEHRRPILACPRRDRELLGALPNLRTLHQKQLWLLYLVNVTGIAVLTLD